MSINISHRKVVSRNWLTFKTGDQYRAKDLHFFSVSGITLSNFKGESKKWKREKVIINVQIPLNQIPIPPKPDGAFTPLFKARNYTVYAGLNSIYNRKHAIYSGHAVDTFRLLNSQRITEILQIECDIAVSDIDAELYRIGFKVDLLLYFDGWQEVIIID